MKIFSLTLKLFEEFFQASPFEHHELLIVEDNITVVNVYAIIPRVEFHNLSLEILLPQKWRHLVTI